MSNSKPKTPPSGEKKKQYTGMHHGVVVSVDDPDKLMRVQVRVKDLFDGVPDSDLPWSVYLLPIGFRANDGFFCPVDVGDQVIVTFPYGGDSRYPMIVGSAHFCPNGTPNFPHESFAGPQSYAHKRTTPELTPTAPAYHRDVVYAQHGVLIEVVSGTGEVRVTQKASGSAIEIDMAGNITAHSEAALYISTKGDMKFTIGGNFDMDVTGIITEQATQHIAKKRSA